MSSFLVSVLSTISQGALYPVVIILIALVALTLVLLVMVIVEYFTERKNFKVSVPQFLRSLEESDCQGIPSLIATSSLIKRQKTALMTLFNARDMPEEARWNVAKRSVYEFGEHYRRRASVAELTAKVAPMLGLMGTLIPLGPGLQALAEGNLSDLASALIVAFDTTVVGLISAAICVVIARVRNRWDADYSNALEAMQGTLYDKIADLEEAGDLSYQPPVFELEPDDGGKSKRKKEKKSGLGAKRQKAAEDVQTDEEEG
ncbi:MAG: MotA/TolQ/ExbB proton channel family protein [Coriobacteriales bacterium]|jgi:biopolymer transport protein ExbB/TolQ